MCFWSHEHEIIQVYQWISIDPISERNPSSSGGSLKGSPGNLGEPFPDILEMDYIGSQNPLYYQNRTPGDDNTSNELFHFVECL